MWVLVAEAGEQVGTCWNIGDEEVIIGRGAGCQIFLRDSAVSRKHCMISHNDEGIAFEDLGSRNTTLLNGAPIISGNLALGDKLTVGQTVFIVANSKDGVPNKGTLAGLDSTIHILPEQLNGAYVGEEADGTPQTVEDLHWLFTASRELSMVRVREQFIEKVAELIQQRFAPDGIMVKGLPLHQSDRKRLYQSGEMQSQNNLSPVEILDGLASLDKGRCIVDTSNGSKICSVVAPISVGEERIGSLMIQRHTNEDGYCGNALEAVVAFCHSVGPLYQSISAVERMVIQQENLRESVEISGSIYGRSDSMAAVVYAMQAASRSDLPVLVQGETGSGKEVVSRDLHKMSLRSEGPFVPVNCAAIPSELFESEMFGHTEGAFTGAKGSRLGRFGLANGGIIFLDEISTLTLENQAKLLRVLENKTFNKVGGAEEVSVDVRIISAANVDIPEAVSQGKFREDLYHRICGITIQVPPLRERKSDIGPLADNFVNESCFQMNELPKTFSNDAMKKLLQWHWPGNVRELRMCIDRAVAYSQSSVIAPEEIMLQESIIEADSVMSLADMEKKHIMKLLDDNEGNISATSKLLGISRTTLYHKLTEYGLRS